MIAIIDIVRPCDGLDYDVEALVSESPRGEIQATVLSNVHAMRIVRRYGDEDREPAGYYAFKQGDLLVLTPKEEAEARRMMAEMTNAFENARAQLSAA